MNNDHGQENSGVQTDPTTVTNHAQNTPTTRTPEVVVRQPATTGQDAQRQREADSTRLSGDRQFPANDKGKGTAISSVASAAGSGTLYSLWVNSIGPGDPFFVYKPYLLHITPTVTLLIGGVAWGITEMGIYARGQIRSWLTYCRAHKNLTRQLSSEVTSAAHKKDLRRMLEELERLRSQQHFVEHIRGSQ